MGLYQKFRAINAISDQSNWMAGLDPSIKVADLHFPGTHNSSASKQFDIKKTPKFEQNNALNWVKKLSWLPGMSFFIKRWMITQEKNIQEQLEQGVRSFDFRLLYKKKEKTFYIAHTFILSKMQNELDSIRRFMETHPKEIIIIRFKGSYEHRKITRPYYAEAAKQIKETLAGMLVTKGKNYTKNLLDDDKFTVGNIQKTKERIFLVFDECPNKDETIFGKEIFKDDWANKPTADEVVKTFKEKKDARVKSSRFFKEASAVVTATANSITGKTVKFFLREEFLRIDGSNYGVKDEAKKVNRKMLRFFDKQPEYREATNVISFDFPAKEDTDAVIKMNRFA